MKKDLQNFGVAPKNIGRTPCKVSKICFSKIKVYITPNIIFFFLDFKRYIYLKDLPTSNKYFMTKI